MFQNRCYVLNKSLDINECKTKCSNNKKMTNKNNRKKWKKGIKNNNKDMITKMTLFHRFHGCLLTHYNPIFHFYTLEEGVRKWNIGQIGLMNFYFR